MLQTLRLLNPLAKHYARARWQELRCGLSRDERNAYMTTCMREFFSRNGVQIHCSGSPATEAGILVANHVSYLDIPLILTQVPVVFLAKSSIRHWPLIGRAAAFVDTIFVKRTSAASRQAVVQEIADAVRAGKRVAIFPAGTTSLNEDRRWNRGAFRIAQKHGLPMQAVRLRYSPMALAAFVGDEFFLTHLHRLRKGGELEAFLEFSEPFYVDDVNAEMARVKAWCCEYLH